MIAALELRYLLGRSIRTHWALSDLRVGHEAAYSAFGEESQAVV